MSFYHQPYIRSVSLKREDIPSLHSYPFNIPSIRFLKDLSLHPNVTFIVGENGMGKSTLLEAIAMAIGFNPEGGSLNFTFSTYDSYSNLDQYLKVVRGIDRPQDGFFLRAESFYNVATNIEEMDRDPMAVPKIIDSFGGKSLHEQSHGEAFFSTFMNRFRGKGLYILDEPEAALSPLRQLSMLSRIHELVKDHSQFIIATHSPILMAYPSSKLIQLTDNGLSEANLEDTSHYQIMKQFFEDRERMLHHLFKEEE
ncbi:AAA family ATPase [Rossellomorea vietnamensis]|uniref:AAA family ATPase n=1 Tax=Rossellomorea vietnamensis TaxID=218284 RepID=UPI00308D759D|nr:AAA family ATPase [Rossellomorea vietnamensis]